MTRISLAASRLSRFAAAALVVFALGATVAEARPGGGGSFGSRGGRTFSAPPSTTTAPRTAAPIERSITQPGPSVQNPGFNAAPQATAQRPGFFSRPGFGTGLVGGLLGAGLIGMLFGHGFMGGLGSLGSIFGLLLQVALIVFAVRFVMRFLQSRRQPAYAGPSPRSGLDPAAGAGGGGLGGGGLGGGGLGGALGGGLGGALGGLGGARQARAPGQPVDVVGIGPADYEAFEQRLVAVNAAWDQEDMAALRGLVTPEMVTYFSEELAGNKSRGLHDRVSGVRLLQGDLAESWREGPVDYATVAMRFSLVNALVERSSSRVVEGDLQRPQEVTEIWTFRRDDGGPWVLSAIQQT